MDHLWNWLHRRGIARSLSSTSNSLRPDVEQLMQGYAWTPRWLILRAGAHSFRHIYPGRATQLRLAKVERHATAADGTRRWLLHYRPTG